MEDWEEGFTKWVEGLPTDKAHLAVSWLVEQLMMDAHWTKTNLTKAAKSDLIELTAFVAGVDFSPDVKDRSSAEGKKGGPSPTR